MRDNIIRSIVRDVMHMLPHSEVKSMKVYFNGKHLIVNWNGGQIEINSEVLKAMESDPLSTIKTLAKTLLAGDDIE